MNLVGRRCRAAHLSTRRSVAHSAPASHRSFDHRRPKRRPDNMVGQPFIPPQGGTVEGAARQRRPTPKTGVGSPAASRFMESKNLKFLTRVVIMNRRSPLTRPPGTLSPSGDHVSRSGFVNWGNHPVAGLGSHWDGVRGRSGVSPKARFMRSENLRILRRVGTMNRRSPLTRPSGTLSPTGGEGRGEGVRIVKERHASRRFLAPWLAAAASFAFGVWVSQTLLHHKPAGPASPP